MSNKNKPQDNAFQQQRLKAWQPLLTPRWVIGTFAVVGILFVPLGLAILSASNNIWEIEQKYDDIVPDGESPDDLCTAQIPCSTVNVSIEIDQDVAAPIFFYYKLTNFYQNHRRYVKSRNDDQLQGILDSDIASCDPLSTFGSDLPLYPCGLIANSMFNDTFVAKIVDADGGEFQLLDTNWDETNIAWESDSEKFIDPADGFDPCESDDYNCVGPGGFQLGPVTDPHFMVWMRTAGLPTFKKLYAVINDRDLVAGETLVLTLENTFPVRGFDGEKFIVLSTTSWLGGKNSFLGIAYIVVGVTCLLLCLGFLIKTIVSPRDLGDMRYFNWPGQSSPTEAEEQKA